MCLQLTAVPLERLLHRQDVNGWRCTTFVLSLISQVFLSQNKTARPSHSSSSSSVLLVQSLSKYIVFLEN